MKEFILLIFGLLIAIAQFLWRFKLMMNQHPNTDLLLRLFGKMGSEARCCNQEDSYH
jgi:hypothetical protein